ncbi:MAG: 30S ribosomal protein S24e [Methermicoccaceae archaeon]
MEIEIIKDRENVLLGRRELKFRVSHEGATPKRAEVRARLVALFNASNEVLLLESLKPVYGSEQAMGYAKIYDSSERLNEVERDHVILRNFPPASKVAEEVAEEVSEEEAVSEGAAETEEGAAPEETEESEGE